MPKRLNTIRLESTEVQGEGSFVVLRRLDWKTAQHNNRALAELNNGVLPGVAERVTVTLALLDTNQQITDEMLRAAIIEWNWVDDAENPLPLPRDAGIGHLSDLEVQFLVRALQPRGDAAKN